MIRLSAACRTRRTPLWRTSFRRTLLPTTALALLGMAFAPALAADVPEYAPNEVLVRFDPGRAKPALTDSLFARLGLSDPAEVIPPAGRSRRARTARETLGAWWKYRLDGALDPAAVADSLNRVSGVTAQPNYLYRSFATPPNDPEWPNQWSAQMVGLEAVWQKARSEAQDSVIVGIIDSGVDYQHPDFAPRIWRNAAEVNGVPGVDDDGNGYVDDYVGWDFTDAPDLPAKGDYRDRDNDPMDESGHGTNVAGVVAAAINNGVGMAGIGVTARIMALRAGADLIFGGGFLEEDDITAAMIYAVENGAKIINMSFGDVVSSPLMRDVVRYADAGGVVLVAAAGNESKPFLLYPAAYDETIAVGATTDADARASFSSYGENLDLVAPGMNILTTRRGGGYTRNGGTSFAAPCVSGAAAIILSLAPYLTPSQVRSMLRTGVVDLGSPGWDMETGFGRLDLPTLVQAASEPVAEILAPARPAGADVAVDWSALVRGAPPVAWSLSYGVGPTPRLWTTLAVGTLAIPSDTVHGALQTASLPDTSYALRLVVTDALGRTREDRTLLAVDHTPPVFTTPLAVRHRWNDTQDHIFLEWETDDLTTGSLRLWHGTQAVGAPEVELPLASESAHHIEELSRSAVGGGPFVAQVRAVNRSGLEGESAFVQSAVQPFSVSQSGFQLVGKLPSGVIMPGTSDFDGNSVPEIAVKLAARAAYDTVSFYELSPAGVLVLRFESPVQMRPAAVADIDGNGFLDLVGFDHLGSSFRVTIAQQMDPGGPPRYVWWEGQYLLAPTLGDVDQDGCIDMIALVDTNRSILRMYEATGPSRLAKSAELVSPVPGLGGTFGIWRAVGDVDGDGRLDIAAGTVGGSIVIFPNTGDNTFGQPTVIPGMGDATRIWGGSDLTGDGRANFAVLRLLEEDKFDLDRRYFRLELYGHGSVPLTTREFSDPRPEGNGFAVGEIGPNNAPALVMAFPPRLYIFAPSASDVDGLTWFAETGIPCQPLIADLDGSGGPEFVFQGPDSLFVMRPSSGLLPPEAPTHVVARPRDSVSVEVSWDMRPGLEYRLWSGPDLNHLVRLDIANPTSPTVLGNLPTGILVRVAVQAINRSQADSISALSQLVAALPHPGPRILTASLVAPDRVIAGFDRPLGSREMSVRDFGLIGGEARIPPDVLLIDHSETRVLLSFPANTVNEANATRFALSFSVRDTSGAGRTGEAPLVSRIPPDAPGLMYALLTSPTKLRVCFTLPVDPASLTPGSAYLVSGPLANEIAPLDAERQTFEIRLASPLAEARTYVLQLRRIRTQDGREFSAGAVIGGKALSASPRGIVAVLQPNSTELWVVTTEPLDLSRMKPEDVLITPRVTVVELAEGPAPEVLVVKLDPDTPVGPWQEEYRIAVAITLADGQPEVLEGTWQPLADRPLTGHLRTVDVAGPTTLRLRFDVSIAPTGQRDRVVRVEPGLRVAGFAVLDTAVEVSLDERTRLGPWGKTYFVHVDSLLTAGGEALTELFALRIPAPATLDSLTIFPQPFRPAVHSALVFGGLPEGAHVRIYSLDGGLVRTLPHSDTGGADWDGRNEAGRTVGAGIYLYVVESPGGKRMGKIAVIR